jgi:hypothetical protein
MFHNGGQTLVVFDVLVDALFELGRDAVCLRPKFGHDRANFLVNETLLLPHRVAVEHASLKQTRLILVGREFRNQALRLLRRFVSR